jgi:hypothetical protein
VFNNGYAKGLEIGSENGYSGGYESGYSDGYDKGFEDGKTSEYDKFWDAFQQNGERTYYERAFTGYNFNSQNLYPKYDIKLVGSNPNMFYAWSNTNEKKFDLAGRLRECRVVLDTSKATNLTNIFSYGRFSTIPPIDLTSCVSGSDYCTGLFSYNYDNLITIEKIIINENVVPKSWFSNSTAIKNITIEGKLAQNGFNVSPCKLLTKDSILSILKALSLNITTTKTITFSTVHQSIIEEDGELFGHMMAAKEAGWSFIYA